MYVIDIETADWNLKTLGDGSVRKDGFIICVGVYDGSNYTTYTMDNARLKAVLESESPKILHNAMYDLSWLSIGYGYAVNGTIHDTMTRQAMIDEYSDLDLTSCCKYYGIEGKNAADTIEAWFDNYKSLYALRGSIWDHADVVWMDPVGRQKMIDYNRQDCIATWNLFHAQEPRMNEIAYAYSIECRLIPLLLEMKRNGIRIDDVERDRFTAFIQNELKQTEQHLEFSYGLNQKVIASPKQMTLRMNQLGIHSPVKTDTGAQSWSADALELIDHPSVDFIQKVKNYKALLDKYLLGPFVNNIVNERIHCTFHACKRDEGGTVTGRLACVKPNMQQIPAREEKHGQPTYGQQMRAMFIPEEGCMLAATDYSAIEAVLLSHYAMGPQAEWLRQRTRDGVDYHTATQEVTSITERDIIKRLNYGIMYGMGIAKMFATNRKAFGTLQHTQEVFNQYHKGLPVIRDTMNYYQDQCKAQGYVTTLALRKMHKPKPVYENGRWNDKIYTTLNHMIQASAADIMKKAMVDIWESGICSTLKMHLTVHDELVNSMPVTKEGIEAQQQLINAMCSAYKEQLLVPLKAVCEVGPNWGYWKSDIWQSMLKGEYNVL